MTGNKKLSLESLRSLPFYVVVACINEVDTNRLFVMLSQQEQEKARRYRRESDRHRHILAHALKRVLLANVLAVDIHDLRFALNEYGKPYCQNPQAPYFNISHSGDWVALALSSSGEVGVDIEFPKKVDISSLISRICSPEQEKAFKDRGALSDAFWYIWSQKEAVSKANGRGLAIGIDNIDVSGAAGHSWVTVFSDRYQLWSQVFEAGVLSYAFANEDALVQAYRLAAHKGELEHHDCCFYEL